MNRFKIIIIAFIVVVFAACERDSGVIPPYTVMFYNVENLFDTIDSPSKFDEEFLPDSPKEWNTERYFKKIEDLSRVIYSVDSLKLPVLIGVCEVENDIVLNDLISQPLLKNTNYQIIWEEGPDFRGIDCALIYNPSVFTIVDYEYIPVICPNEPEFITRDLLYVSGMLNEELFHLFVVHWPSRRGGADVSEPKRILAASVLRRKVDELFEQYTDVNIIIMGDMNDEPSDMSLSDVLMAIPNKAVPGSNDLVNLMYDVYEQGLGSYTYRGSWDMIDNIVVSGHLINKEEGLRSSLDNGFIFNMPFMEYVNSRGEMSPNRTYGRSYFGGISDHFPVYMTLE
jgi:hypothetical protein